MPIQLTEPFMISYLLFADDNLIRSGNAPDQIGYLKCVPKKKKFTSTEEKT